MLRKYLVEYQSINNCGKVTIDNIRRSLSTFFSWLEEEDYIIKPVRLNIDAIDFVGYQSDRKGDADRTGTENTWTRAN